MVKLLSLLLLVTVCSSIEGQNVSDKLDMRLVGGSYAKLGQYPFVVTIQDKAQKKGHVCSGVIIGRKWILTAAHCVNKKEKYVVKAGTINLSVKGSDQQKKNVCKIIIHPDYTPVKPNFLAKHDFALIKVRNFKFNDFVKPAKLPKDGAHLPIKAIISGWGAIDAAGHKMQARLKHLNVSVPEDQKACGDYYPDFNTKNYICTSPKGQKQEGACIGDDGAPLVENDTVYGIVSTTDYPCGDRTPTIYAKIQDAIKFIKKTAHI